MSHTVEHTERDGFPTLCLRSPEGLAATYVPSAGMVCCSLRQGDEELLFAPSLGQPPRAARLSDSRGRCRVSLRSAAGA